MSAERWTPFLLLILIAGILLKVTLLVVLATALLMVLVVASWWRKHSLDNVSYHRRFHYTRAFPGEVIKLRIEVENRKLLPISWLRVQDPWPKAVGPEDETILAGSHILNQGYLTNVFSLRWFERSRRTYSLLFRKRGVYAVGPAQLESGDLFGFYEKSREEGPVETLTVFPTFLPLSDLELIAEDPFGDRASRRRLFEDPSRPMGVRAYHPEDGFRRIHWPATARTGSLQVKVDQPVSGRVMMVCLNVATFARHWEGIYPELLEYLVRAAATLVDQGLKAGYHVGMISNSCLAHSDQPFRIPPSRSPQQLAHLLQALAAVTPLVTSSFERFLMFEVPKISYGATLVVLTAVVSPELAETLVRIKKHEHRMMLYSLAETPPPNIPGVKIIHRPFVEPSRE